MGRAPEASGIALPEGLAGVSRRHCTLVREAGETLLVDHSSFGTLVNGERVCERVRVHAGDRIRLGEPGVELTLIAVAGASASHASEHHAAPAQN
jgi:pSer/pThr/pTyr-binding forkhead associated (FHA) protein